MTGATLATAGLIGTGLYALAIVSPDLTDAAIVTVHLEPELAEERQQGVLAGVQALPGVRGATRLTATELLDDLRTSLSDTPELLEGVEAAWLPPVIEVEPAGDATALGAILSDMEGVSEVHGTQLGQAALSRLGALQMVASTVGWALLFLLILATAALVSGASGLHALASREETDLMRLFGATETFVRLPLIWEGAVLGALGSGLAGAAVMGTVAAARAALGGPLPGLGGLPVELPPVWTWALFLLTGPLLGALGASVVAGRSGPER